MSNIEKHVKLQINLINDKTYEKCVSSSRKKYTSGKLFALSFIHQLNKMTNKLKENG